MFQDLLSVLLKYEVDINKQLSAGKDKMTPLMIAAARGHLDMARRLVQAGAIVEKLGKSYLPWMCSYSMKVFGMYGSKEMVKLIFLKYLVVLHSPNLHQLFILAWFTDVTWWFVSFTYISSLSDHG